MDSAGNFVWVRQIGGSSNDQGNGIAVDASGNVLTTGLFTGTVDFDPGAGTSNLTSAGGTDIFVSKLDSAGNFVWAEQLGGTFGEFGLGIAVDASGNVLTTGTFSGTEDFDPGAGTFNLTALGMQGAFVSKLTVTPTVAADALSVNANEGGTAANTGTFHDPDGNSTVTLTAKVAGVPFGTITPNNAAGTWGWSAPSGDGPAGPFTVTITATDDQNNAANATFTYTVNNVPPTATLATNTGITYGSSATATLGSPTDPSAADTTAGTGTFFKFTRQIVPFTIDATPPVVTITSAPPAQSDNATARFAFFAQDPTSDGISSGVDHIRRSGPGRCNPSPPQPVPPSTPAWRPAITPSRPAPSTSPATSAPS